MASNRKFGDYYFEKSSSPPTKSQIASFPIVVGALRDPVSGIAELFEFLVDTAGGLCSIDEYVINDACDPSALSFNCKFLGNGMSLGSRGSPQARKVFTNIDIIIPVSPAGSWWQVDSFPNPTQVVSKCRTGLLSGIGFWGCNHKGKCILGSEFLNYHNLELHTNYAAGLLLIRKN